MATTKNITMKQFNGTDYDTLYPKTIGAQIVGAVPIASGGTNGTTAPSGVNNLVAGLSQITPASKDLFPFRDISGNTGGSVTLANLAVALGNNGVITPSNLDAQASALGFTKIQTGSYVGTGTYGADNPCSLTFDFAPSFLFMLTYSYTGDFDTQLVYPLLGANYSNNTNYKYNCVLPLAFITTEYATEGTSSRHSSLFGGHDYLHAVANAKKSSNGRTVYWYHTGGADGQFNSSNCTYYYMALN